MSNNNWKTVLGFAPFFVMALAWFMAITSRQERQDTNIINNKNQIEKNFDKVEKLNEKIDENFVLIQDKLDKILYHEINQR